MGAGALLLGQVTAVFVFLTLMFALDEYVLPLWAAALVTTLLAAAIVGLLIALAMSEFKAFSPVPRRFLRSLTEDLQWAKTQFRSNVR
jgi:tetrahydromethanopterin S-methyltransferase subunit C